MKRSELKQLIREAIEEVKPKVEGAKEDFAPETDEIGSLGYNDTLSKKRVNFIYSKVLFDRLCTGRTNRIIVKKLMVFN